MKWFKNPDFTNCKGFESTLYFYETLNYISSPSVKNKFHSNICKISLFTANIKGSPNEDPYNFQI